MYMSWSLGNVLYEEETERGGGWGSGGGTTLLKLRRSTCSRNALLSMKDWAGVRHAEQSWHRCGGRRERERRQEGAGERERGQERERGDKRIVNLFQNP